MLKKIGYFVLVLLLLLGVVSYIFIQNNKPNYKGSISMNSLDEVVRIYFDDYGIPHIFADNEEDAYRAFGYVHAQDRLWQMELIRRITAGRLSEVFGPDMVKTDKLFRSMRLGSVAKEAAQASDKNSRSFILADAYLEGINQFIAEGKTPIEFRLVGLEKEAYTLEDIYNVFGFMAFSFAQAYKTDPLLSSLQADLDKAYLSDLDIDINPKTTLIRNSRGMKRMADAIGTEINDMMNTFPVPPFVGSNSWVLGPQKTKNGKVIFANDPHIKFSQPSVWYQAHIVCPEMEMYGFYLALSPFAVLGHNYDYAYGITMFENDDMDFFFEDKNQNFSSVQEVIKVKGEEDIIFEVKIGTHGPIINGGFETIESDIPVSMDWIYVSKPSDLLKVSYQMSHASNIYEFRDAVSQINGPGLNMMYGDAKGNIAWFAAGQLYDRGEEVHTKFIMDGSGKPTLEKRLLDFEQNPQAINPSWHYVYSANNQPEEVNDKLYPGYYLPEDRAKRIVDLIKEKESFTAEDVELMINDVGSSINPRLVKIILDNISKVNLNETEKKAMALLKNWDGSYTKEDPAPTIYTKFVYLFLKNTFEDEMGEERFQQFLQTHLYKRQIAKQLKWNRSIWWDDIHTKEVKELKDEIITRSFHQGIKELTDQFGNEPEQWNWSKALSVEHKHSFDKSGLLRGYFNVGPFETNGGLEVINNHIFDLDSSGVYNVKTGPSTRRVIDFSDVENAKAIIPTGQSGNVFSKHYDDQSEKYLKGEFVKMMLNKEEIKKSKDILVLLPQKDSIEN